MSAKRFGRQRSHVALRTLILIAAVTFASCTQLKQCAYQGIDRDEWQKPKEVIQALSIQRGDHIADLGSGGGYFTFRLADAAGPAGKVYAVDIDEGLNQALAERAREEGYQNIEVILAKVDDPLLPESGVDLIFITNTYHHLQDRVAYFKNVKKYLRPGGRIAVVEFSPNAWLESTAGHATPPDTIKKEMAEAGYTLQNEFEFLPRQSFLVFTPAARGTQRRDQYDDGKETWIAQQAHTGVHSLSNPIKAVTGSMSAEDPAFYEPIRNTSSEGKTSRIQLVRNQPWGWFPSVSSM